MRCLKKSSSFFEKRLASDDSHASRILQRWLIVDLQDEARSDEDFRARFSFEKLTENGEALESVVMAACREASGYNIAQYMRLRETATLTELVRAIYVRRALEWQGEDVQKQIAKKRS